MTTLLVKNATLLAALDDADNRWEDGGLYVVDNAIRHIGPTDGLPREADVVLDARGMVILPGLVNTHHHFYQTLTRNVPAAQDANLFQWLRTLYPLWAGLTPEAIYVSSKVAIAELMLSGCTTSSDHTYIWPNGARLDDQIRAATELGFRFHPRVAPCPSVKAGAGCHPTAWWRTRTLSCATRGASWSSTTTPRATRCYGSFSRPARPSRSRPT